ncbi:type VII secretion protein EccE [Streptomyces sp. NPDC097619]|uniref:type VII secretion protein EccE n=1 Tax=Streptomyces sp. NPDC097619 TaxID=3157228 RepID=UPI00332A78A9
MLAQLAFGLLLVGATSGRPWRATACAVAGGLCCVALTRRKGRALPARLVSATALRARRRRAGGARTATGAPPGTALLVECEPALRTWAFTGGRDRRPVGMIGDGAFLTALVRVDPECTALRRDRSGHPLPLSLVRAALDTDGILLESAQVVQFTRPAPATHLPEHSLAVRNYAPLQARTGTPAVRLTWIALKLDPALCEAAVTARGGGALGAQRALVRVADQLAGRLSGAGFGATVLTEPELVAALAVSCCANPLAADRAGRAGTPVRRTEERSRSWRCDDRVHATYRVARWPRLGGASAPLPRFAALLSAGPALATHLSVTLRPGPRGDVLLSGHVRLTGRNEEELAAARAELERTARGVRAGLVPFDGEQLPGVLASLPLGGVR